MKQFFPSWPRLPNCPTGARRWITQVTRSPTPRQSISSSWCVSRLETKSIIRPEMLVWTTSTWAWSAHAIRPAALATLASYFYHENISMIASKFQMNGFKKSSWTDWGADIWQISLSALTSSADPKHNYELTLCVVSRKREGLASWQVG